MSESTGDARLDSFLPETDQAAVVRMLGLAFASPPERATEWLTNATPRAMRVWREGPVAKACFMRIAMGQYFGGRSVPMLGVAAVAVPPEDRGRGRALRMMREAMREAWRDGFPLAGLYASTQALYRRVGFEQAGHRSQHRLPLAGLDLRERTGEIVPLDDITPEVTACYARFVANFNGPLDRAAYIWNRITKFRDEVYTGFGVRGPDGGLDGYLWLAQRRKPDTFRQEIVLSDAAFVTPHAGRRLLGLLADFAMIADEVVFSGGAWHPWMALLGQQRCRSTAGEMWMTRIVRLKEALESRGYPGGVTGEAHLDVADELLPENAGRWVLRVTEGRGSVERGGRGEIVLDVRALAPLYTGFMSAAQLALAGWARGSEPALARASALFAGTAPWMADMF